MHPPVSPAPNSQTLLGEYLSFLKVPTYDRSLHQARKIWVNVWRLFAAHFMLINIPAVVLLSIASRWITAIEDNKVGDLFEKITPFQIFLLAVVLIPFFEELMFRLPLRFSVRNLTIPFTLLLLMGGSLILQARGASGSESLILLITVVLGSVACTLLLKRINRHQGDRWFSRHLFCLVYGECFVVWVGPHYQLSPRGLGCDSITDSASVGFWSVIGLYPSQVWVYLGLSYPRLQ